MRDGSSTPYWAPAVASDALDWHRWVDDPPRAMCGADAAPSRRARIRHLPPGGAVRRPCEACDAALRYPPAMPGEDIVWVADAGRSRGGRPVFHPTRDCVHFRGRTRTPYPIPLRIAEATGRVRCTVEAFPPPKPQENRP